MNISLSSLQYPDVKKGAPVEGVVVALLHHEDLIVQLLPGQHRVEVRQPDSEVRGPVSVGNDEGGPLSSLALRWPVSTSGLNLPSPQSRIGLLQVVSLLQRKILIKGWKNTKQIQKKSQADLTTNHPPPTIKL